MRKLQISLFAVFVGALVPACGGGGGSSDGSTSGGNTLSCTTATDFGALTDAGDGGSPTLVQCQEYPNPSSSIAAEVARTCSASYLGMVTGLDAGDLGFVLTEANGPCSRQGAVGGCMVTSAGVTAITWLYAPETIDNVRTLCSGLGTVVSP